MTKPFLFVILNYYKRGEFVINQKTMKFTICISTFSNKNFVILLIQWIKQDLLNVLIVQVQNHLKFECLV